MSFHPQTPQSPSQLSPGISDPASSMNTSLTSITTALPTPAHSVNGSASQPSDMSHDVAMGDDPSQKRKRSVDDQGDREQKKAHFEGSRLGIEDLHLDVGEKYLLCQTPHRTQRFPNVTEDLFELFGLTDIAAEVAREKPNGEKNALRKTYKGHIKRLGVMGRFEPVEKDWEEPKEAPAEDQHDADEQAVQAKKLESPYFGFGKITTQHDADFWRGRQHLMNGWTREAKAAEHRAVAMAKGAIPVKIWDSSVLGDITPAGADAKQGAVSKTAPGTPLGIHGAAGVKPKPVVGGVQPPPGVVRPQRVNKKRGYGDSSFDGYGDGFPDDGYSTGDGEGGSQKRRKKAVGTPQFQQNGTPRQTWGPMRREETAAAGVGHPGEAKRDTGKRRGSRAPAKPRAAAKSPDAAAPAAPARRGRPPGKTGTRGGKTANRTEEHAGAQAALKAKTAGRKAPAPKANNRAAPRP